MNIVLSVRDLALQRGARDILRGVSFDVAAGEIVALMGLSGSGKTTILRVIADLEADARGVIAIGADRTSPGQTRAGHVGMVFQFHCLFEHLTVLENLCLAPVRVQKLARAAAETRAIDWLEQLGIGHRKTALPKELSGGEAQRAAIGRALAMDPALLLLDEPTAALDPPRRTALGGLLAQLAATGRGVLVTSHDVDFVRAHASRVLILADGAIVEDGLPARIFEQPSHDATRTLLQIGRSARA